MNSLSRPAIVEGVLVAGALVVGTGLAMASILTSLL